MENTSHSQLLIPRLHFTKSSSSHDPSSSSSSTQQAGPSRLQDKPRLSVLSNHQLSVIESDDGDSDQTTTPRVSATNTLRMLGSAGVNSSANDAARLRSALGGRSLGSGLKSFMSSDTPSSQDLTPIATNNTRRVENDHGGREEETTDSYSELDSEVDPPLHMSTARESMKQLFDRAMAEPMASPRRIRRRRSSIDYGEVDASPRIEKQRSTVRAKRKSASDEEGEHSFKALRRGESTYRSSTATFDLLRERLAGLRQPRELVVDGDALSTSSVESAGEGSNDTARIMRDIERIPPEATSTPLQSLQSLRMSTTSQFQFQSNLLEQDSEMQRAIAGMGSYIAEGPSQRAPFSIQRDLASQNIRPTPHRSEPTTTSNDPSSGDDREETLSLNDATERHNWEPNRPSSRMSSVSSVGSPDSKRDETEMLKERERDWDRNLPRSTRPETPESKYSTHRLSLGSSPMLARRTSMASLRSEASSREGSMISQSDYDEGMKEIDRERNHERERQWNRPRPNSNLGHFRSPSDRPRTISQPLRPDSAQSFNSPDRFTTRSRRLSTSSSRASSPGGSEDPVVSWEKTKERERNWGAPNPIWSYQPAPPQPHTPSRTPSRSSSPLPPSVSPSPLRHHNGHIRSMSEAKSSESPRSNIPRISPHTSAALRRPRTISSPSPRPNSYQGVRPASPLVSRSPRNVARPTRSVSQTLPKSTSLASRQETETETEYSPDPVARPGSRLHPTSPSPTQRTGGTSSRLGLTSKSSMIPVKSPRRNMKAESELDPELPAPKVPMLYPRSARVPPSHDGTRSHATRDDEEALERTPTIRPLSPLPDAPELETTTPPHSPSPPQSQPLLQEPEPETTTPPSSPPRPVPAANGVKSSQPELPNSPLPNVTILSPPPSPLESSSMELFASVLQTPPRPPSPESSSYEFDIPPLPKDFPALPVGPPSSDDDTDSLLGDRTPEPEAANGLLRLNDANVSTMKTPKPPGAWFTTPTPGPGPTEKEAAARAVPATPTPATDPVHEEESTSMNSELDIVKSTPVHLQKQFLESGLATPAASISKGTQLPAQTPALPGGWVPTPAATARKSILRVRFENPPADSSSELDRTDESNFLAPGADSRKGKAPMVEDDSSVDMSGISTTQEDETIHAIPPGNGSAEPKPSSGRNAPNSPSKKKTSSLEVMDEYGNPVRSQQEHTPPATPRSNETPKKKKRRGLQIVDAMGRAIDDEDFLEESQVQAELTMRNEDSVDLYVPPRGHGEALVRLRHGLADLAQGLDNLERSSTKAKQETESGKLTELNDASRAARKSRQNIVKNLQSVQKETKEDGGITSLDKEKIEPHAERRLFTLSLWAIAFGIFVQFILAAFLYRLSVSHAQDLFLTTYYDPFYADIHLVTVKPFTSSPSPSTQLASWESILNTLWNKGWSAFFMELANHIALLANMGRRYIWETWGQDSVQDIASWPPT